MLPWIFIFNYSIALVGLTICVFALRTSFHLQHLNSWSQRYFFYFFIFLAMYMLSNLIFQLSLSIPGPRFSLFSRVSLLFETLFFVALIPCFTIYILHICNEKYSGYLMTIIVILGFVCIASMIIAQFSEDFFLLTPDNEYKEGSSLPFLFLPPILMLLTNLIGIIRRIKKLPEEEKSFLFTYHIVLIAALILQLEFSNILIITLCCDICAAITLQHINNKEIECVSHMNEKIIEADFRAKTLQMRPHFIYNTLSNIYYLCQLDPEKAQKVIDDFSTYLKKNFGAVAKQGLITFEEELEHTKAYLAVVKARYEDLLFIDYDTPLTNFKLPPLSMEPLVENAVKHALDPDSDPLYIMIRTRREGSFNLIIVENTGVDFPFEDTANFSSLVMNDEPHIGLANVKSRLETSCGGSLTITKRPDGGTIATIRIPADQTAFERKNSFTY